jgi:thiamine biosynthesis lipoprotein ApbE
VTVVAATAFRAGCYATASFLLGPADGLELLEKAENVEGALITEGGEILTTTGMWLLSDLPGGAWEGCREV